MPSPKDSCSVQRSWPALRLRMIDSRESIRLINPTGPSDTIEAFRFAAYDRTDRQITANQDHSKALNGLFFPI
jgi:hypothetical protein